MGSAYMDWVKTQTHAAFNLANSGVKSYPLSGLPVDFQALTLSGPGAYGYAPLVNAIAAKCKVAPENVATAQGTSMANYLAMATALEPGDDVLIEHPAYPLLWETAEYLGASVRFFERRPEDGFAIDVDAIKRAITRKVRLIILTNLHNPNCAFKDEQTLRRIGELAKSVGARVLVDEVYMDLLFEDAPSTAARLGPEFVVTNSLTKVYGLSGLRCGWILGEPDLIRRIFRVNDLLGVNNPYVTDQISCIALENLGRIAQWSRELLEKNRTLANEFVTATPEVECEPLETGTVVFPRINLAVDRFCGFLRERYETVITPGHFFGARERVRIGIGGDTNVLAAGLERIHDALHEISMQ